MISRAPFLLGISFPIPPALRRGRVAVLLVCLSVACQSDPDHRATSKDSRTVRVGSPGEIGSFALAEAYGYYQAQVTQLLFEGLTIRDEGEQVVPGLARDWSVSPDGREYRFTLRSGVTFHDGTPFRAADVVRSWTTALGEPPAAATHPWMLDPIDGALEFSRGERPEVAGLRVLDDSTLIVRLAEPLVQFPALLSLPQAAISSEGSSDSVPIGSGPWRWVSGDGEGGDDVALARHEGYWGPPPLLDSLVYHPLEMDRLVSAFEAGAVDLVTEMPVRVRLEWAARSDLGFAESEALGLTRLAINMKEPVFADVRVRRALNHAIDATQLAMSVGVANAVRATGGIPPSFAGADPARQAYRFDPAVARRLLQEGGYPADRPLRLWVPEPGFVDYPPQFGSLLRDYLRGAGLTVELHIAGDSLDQALPERWADLVLSVWFPDYPDGEALLYPLFHSNTAGSAGNEGSYRDPEFDRLIDAARRERDPARRVALLRSADQRLHDQAPAVFLWFAREQTAYSLRLAGWSGRPQLSRFVSIRLPDDAVSGR